MKKIINILVISLLFLTLSVKPVSAENSCPQTDAKEQVFERVFNQFFDNLSWIDEIFDLESFGNLFDQIGFKFGNVVDAFNELNESINNIIPNIQQTIKESLENVNVAICSALQEIYKPITFEVKASDFFRMNEYIFNIITWKPFN